MKPIFVKGQQVSASLCQATACTLGRSDARSHPNLNWDLKTIIFSPALGDQAHLLSVPHDHFVPQRGQNRLTQGECVPVSIAMRHRGMLLNTCFMASGVVATLCPKTISPASFKTQYALERSPRSTPMVSCPSKIFFPLVCIVLIFCIAGLLFFVPRARQSLGAYRIPWETGLLIPSGKRALRQTNHWVAARADHQD